MGRQMGLQRTGNLDIVYDMQPGHQDPDYAAFYDQAKIFKHQWPEALKRDLEKAWQHHQERLARAAHPWQVARGPVAAMQCYLQEKGWRPESLSEWAEPGRNGAPDFKILLNEAWPTIKAELKRAEQSDRILKISGRSMLQDVQRPLDWKPWQRMNQKVNQHDACALQTWHQRALFTKISDSCEGQHLQCPHCAQAATAVHLLWLCKDTTKVFQHCIWMIILS